MCAYLAHIPSDAVPLNAKRSYYLFRASIRMICNLSRTVSGNFRALNRNHFSGAEFHGNETIQVNSTSAMEYGTHGMLTLDMDQDMYTNMCLNLHKNKYMYMDMYMFKFMCKYIYFVHVHVYVQNNFHVHELLH
jgi:hypothetical protein